MGGRKMSEHREEQQTKKNEWVEWLKAIVIAVVIAAVVRIFMFSAIMVDGISVMPTLEDGDKMIANKISYVIGEPKRFDIIVFNANPEEKYIKRVIGLPGDTVEYRDDVLYINGEPQEEPYLEQLKATTEGTLTGDFTLEEMTGEQTIPEGHLFVMGDNRRNSTDSRHIGLIPYEEVIGKTNFIYWPIDNGGRVH